MSQIEQKKRDSVQSLKKCLVATNKKNKDEQKVILQMQEE